MIRALMLAAMFIAGAAGAQQAPEGLVEAPGAVLRGLDKVAGTASDIALSNGQSVQFGHITVNLHDCRYPPEDPASNAYAFVTISEESETVFSGWMIADSPALSALDHQRYDVWVMRCKID